MLKKLVTFSIFFALVTQSIISEVKANTNYDCVTKAKKIEKATNFFNIFLNYSKISKSY